MPRTPVTTEIEPTPQEIDGIVRELEQSWKSTITVKRKAPNDVGYRDVYISLDGKLLAVLHHGEEITHETSPGSHRLQANNTLFRKTIDFTLSVGEHASFIAVNRAGWGTYSVWAFFLGFLGAGPFYLTFEREGLPGGHDAHRS